MLDPRLVVPIDVSLRSRDDEVAIRAPWSGLRDIERRLRLTRGATLVRDGEPVERVFRVARGVLRATRLLPDGRRQVLDFIHPGETIGLDDPVLHLCSIEAVTDVDLLAYPRAAFDRHVQSDPATTRWLVARLRDGMVRIGRRVDLLRRRSAEERVALFLLTGVSSPSGDADRLWLPMSRIDIADFVGLRIETISRAFAHLKVERCIAEPSRTQVVVLDRARLEAIAEPA